MATEVLPTEANSDAKPTNGSQPNFAHPQRARTRVRRRGSQVLVLITSSESLYLADEESLDQCSKPLKTIPLPRTPWANSQDVYVPDMHEEEQYVGTVKVNKIGHGMAWKRLTGAVKEMYVYDRPPRSRTRSSSMTSTSPS
ncbi:MAG: hypothetical protein M1821_002098 [Bathelium mastoideum]|nr:MAG: hypothetical protein M1821_002098 [Bathelium mastoideum]KAI9692607.1 MAG: hypothetical protein M1822_006838 [Bathelium mastoideum]